MANPRVEHLVEAFDEERSTELEELLSVSDRLLETAGAGKWRPRELQARARNGDRAGVVSLAFWQLINDGRLVLDGDLRVRRSTRR